jgi:hypothetical protein
VGITVTDTTNVEAVDVKDTEQYEVLMKLMKQNERREADLAERYGVRVDQAQLIMARINLLIEMVMPSDSMNRVGFETNFHVMISKSLDELEGEIRKAQLAGQMRTPSKAGLIVPGM